MRRALATLSILLVACAHKPATTPSAAPKDDAPTVQAATDDVDPNGMRTAPTVEPTVEPPPPPPRPAASAVPAWVFGEWGVDCTPSTPSFTFIRLGPSRVRQKHANGNAYEFDVTVNDDVIVMEGEYQNAPMTIKWRIIDPSTLHYFYHYFSGKEWPADARYQKCN